MTAATELLERVRAAKGPDREIDRDLFWRFHREPAGRSYRNATLGLVPELPEVLPPGLGQHSVMNAAPRYTESIDRTRNLCNTVLPGWLYRVAECSVSDDAWVMPDFNDPLFGEPLQDRFPAALQDPLEYFGTDVDRRPAGQPALAFLEAILIAVVRLEELEPAT